MTTNKVSVIVPVYKVEQYLDRCVESILNQTYSKLELILVDDGSPDNCPKMCDDWALKDKRIKVIHQQNQGLSGARNSGIDYALTTDSEWITFIDSDDWVHSKYLEILLNSALNNNVNISCCGFEEVSVFKDDSDIRDFNTYIGTLDDIIKKAKKYNIFNTSIACARLYKKFLFNDIRFPLGRYHEDEFIIYKVLTKCEKICSVDLLLYNYYVNNTGIMHSGDSIKKITDCLDSQYIKTDFLIQNGYSCGIESLKNYILLCNKFNNRHKGEQEYNKLIKKYLRKIKRYIRKNKKILPKDIWSSQPFIKRAVKRILRILGIKK